MTVTTTTITIDSVKSSNDGVFSSFGIKKLGDTVQTASPLPTSLGSLTAGTCYKLTIVLFCDSLEGAETDQVICTQHEVSVDAAATTTGSFSVVWPMVAQSLTDNSVTVTTYKSTVGSAAAVDLDDSQAAATVDDLTPPGSVKSLSTEIVLAWSGVSQTLSASGTFCLKPDVATISFDDSVVQKNSIQLVNLGVATGQVVGHTVSVSGCGLTSAIQMTTLDGTASVEGLSAGCLYDVEVAAFCTPDLTASDTGKVTGAALTDKHCTSLYF